MLYKKQEQNWNTSDWFVKRAGASNWFSGLPAALGPREGISQGSAHAMADFDQRPLATHACLSPSKVVNYRKRMEGDKKKRKAYKGPALSWASSIAFLLFLFARSLTRYSWVMECRSLSLRRRRRRHRAFCFATWIFIGVAHVYAIFLFESVAMPSFFFPPLVHLICCSPVLCFRLFFGWFITASALIYWWF